jgi:NAD-dependent dihydropyrimidine dehydrogenase PreA subunit
MAYVITQGCTKDAACVDVCPVDCIHPRKDEPEYEQVDMLHIDPENCIDCGACVPVCPVSVIYAADDLPEQLKSFLEVNAAYFAKAH